jgi:hypothetical protein
MYRSLSLYLGLAFLGSTALAAGFEAKTMRDPFANREVDRGLVLGKGWAQINLGSDFKPAVGYWDSDGEPVDFENANWLYSTQQVSARYGITHRGEMYWTFKTHYVSLTNDALGTDISQFGIGDPEFGYKLEVFRTLTTMTSVIVYGNYKAPLGNENPGNSTGGANSFSTVILTTGTPDLTFGAAAKRSYGPAAFHIDAGYTYRASSLTKYMMETEVGQFNTRIKPGDVIHVQADVMFQVAIAALSGGITVEQRNVTKAGPSSGGLSAARNLIEIEGSDGWSLDADAGLLLNSTRGVDLIGGVSIPLRGEDLQFFPIEDIHPTRGNTYTGTFAFRY